jgi:uncharacterized membrane protein
MMPLFPDIKTFFFYGIGALALIALAEYQPQLAVLLAVILIAGVVLTHWQDYTSLFNVPTTSTTPTAKTKGA